MLRKLLVTIIGALFLSTVAYASLVVIGSKDIRISHLNDTQLSDLYLGKSVTLPTGETLNPIDQDPNSPIYAQFYNQVIGMDPSSVNSYWSGLVFSGTGTQPPQVEGDRSAIAAVENNKKSIAYVDSKSLGPQLANVKILYGSVPDNEQQSDQQQATQTQSPQNPEFTKDQATNAQLRQKLAQEIAALKIQQERYKKLNAQREQQLLRNLKAQQAVQQKHPGATATISSSPRQSITSAPTADLWSAMRSQFKLSSNGHSAAVKQELKWYLAHRWIVNMILKNAEPYIGYVFQQTQKRQIPAEFALLPMIESGYVPFAQSSAGAAGLWQILPNTAMGNALKINWWYDGRLDVVTSTEAALDYLSRLHAGLGSWELAAAAYNAGEGSIVAAMDLNKRKGVATNFWSLSLPQQTRHYVPKLLALAAIVSNPSKYGFKLPALTTQPNFATIKLDSQIDRAQIADLAGTTEEVVHELNPGMLRWATAPHGSYTIAIPTDKLSTFKINLARLSQQKRLLWVYHEVNGESLASLAKRYHTTVTELKKVNNLKSSTLTKGEGIIVPILSNKTYAGFNAAVQKAPVNDIDQVTADGLLDDKYQNTPDNQTKPALPKPQAEPQPSQPQPSTPAEKPPAKKGDDLKTLMDKLYE